MPKYRVLIEKKVDVEAESEDAAKRASLAMVDAEACVAWEIEDEDDKRGAMAAGY
jgi:hypothetical protein